MEIPIDIWKEIIYYSRKTTDEIVADMNLDTLKLLELSITNR